MKQFANLTRPVRGLATAALVSASLFPLTVIALNLVQRGRYSPIRQAISELALGTGGDAMVLAFCGLGAGIFLLALIIFRTSRQARVTPLLLAIASVFAGPMSAAFRTDRTGARATLHGAIHDGAGLAAFVLILVAMIAAAYRFRHEPAWRSLATETVALAAIGAITFLLIPILGNGHFGLAQRLFVGTFVLWILLAAAHARTITADYATSRPPSLDEDGDGADPRRRTGQSVRCGSQGIHGVVVAAQREGDVDERERDGADGKSAVHLIEAEPAGQ
jgi:hypothetical protein